MRGMEDLDDLPARRVAIASMAAVEAGDRGAWLALFAPDAMVQDPIGPSPLDPSGEGHRGTEAIAAFYDDVISLGRISFEIRASYVAGNECANAGTITTTFPDGTRSIVDGVYTYRVDDEGHITALRAYWEFDKLRMEKPS